MNSHEPNPPAPELTTVAELKKHYPDLYALTGYVPVRRSIKIFDKIIAAVVFLLTIPLWIIILLIYIIESLLNKDARGPLIVSYQSCSQGKFFLKLKLRIFKMRIIDNDLLKKFNYKAFPDEDFVAKNDFTFLGLFLKQTFLDELPQFFNIFKGDISIIGPRAVPVEVYERLRRQGYLFHLLKAGLISDTHARKGSAEYKKTYLIYDYIRMYIASPTHKLVWRNLSILFRAIVISLQRKGRYTRLGD